MRKCRFTPRRFLQSVWKSSAGSSGLYALRARARLANGRFRLGFFLRVTKWSPGCVLTDAIARELATENVGAEYRCDECGKRGTTTRSWRYLQLAPCLFISVDRTQFHMGTPTPQKRLGRVKLPDTMSLHTAHGTVQYKLVAAACHRGAEASSGHWLT